MSSLALFEAVPQQTPGPRDAVSGKDLETVRRIVDEIDIRVRSLLAEYDLHVAPVRP